MLDAWYLILGGTLLHFLIGLDGLYGGVLAARDGVDGELLGSKVVAADVALEIANRRLGSEASVR